MYQHLFRYPLFLVVGHFLLQFYAGNTLYDDFVLLLNAMHERRPKFLGLLGQLLVGLDAVESLLVLQ